MKPYLHQFLAKTGAFASKKEIDRAIHDKKIKVDGKVITDKMHKVSWKKTVHVNGQELTAIDDRVYLVINKPVGMLSTKLTDRDRYYNKKSVFDLVTQVSPKIRNTLFAVGRLDESSSGLLIITNDGKLGNKIANPSSKVKRKYRVSVNEAIDTETLRKIAAGVDIMLEHNGMQEIYRTLPCTIQQVDPLTYKMTLTEGKKREIRRMFEAVNRKVISLERTAIGSLTLQDLHLPPGSVVSLSRQDLDKAFP